ncbi:uncharacterized protein DS421_7g213680 [Arachis hypogaea]|nr:uncharacterized protein DS421_7g213680 [Arachis hypogaea]
MFHLGKNYRKVKVRGFDEKLLKKMMNRGCGGRKAYFLIFLIGSLTYCAII